MHTHVLTDEIALQQVSESPLVLKARGSFFVGGEAIEQSFVELGSRRPADRVTINQMYVEYMVPEQAGKVPVVMVHGAGLSGNSYDTTPDGRMGWYEYFVRRQHPVYVVDQVGRARSGFNQATFNNVGAEVLAPSAQPSIVRMGDRVAAWVNFRFGPEPGVPYDDTQFPIEAVRSLSRRSIPDLTATLPTRNPNIEAISALATGLKEAVLLGHSQSGAYPLEAALLGTAGIRGIVLIEPGASGGAAYSDAEIGMLSAVPLLIVFGDHLDTPTGLPGPGWPERFEDCQTLISRLRDAGGTAEMLHLPDLGIRGNSHMLMMDKNHLAIADLILAWIDQHAPIALN